MEFVILVIIILIIFAIYDINNKLTERIELLDKVEKQTSKIVNYAKALSEITRQKNYYNGLYEEVVAKLYSNSVLLPSLIRWADNLKILEDEAIVKQLTHKVRPAFKSAEEVKIAKAQARQYKKEVEVARNRVDLYESLAPWLIDYTELSLEEILDSLKEENERMNTEGENQDPIAFYLSKSDWNKLTASERNQLALDRYSDKYRKKTPWQIGIEYERYVGYVFEQDGYNVKYQGVTQGKEDLGIDLICTKGNQTLIIQCKRFSRAKGTPVRENVVAQTYGTTQLYRMQQNDKYEVTPVIVTSYELSEEALKFAKYLNVKIVSNFEYKDYPMIKCNISNVTNEKIYHLPMDQQYDNITIGNAKCFYVKTVADAERQGYRRAYRWQGNKV